MKLPPGHVAGQGVIKPKCTGGFGERMLRTMGWEAGQGLGKEGQGMKEAISVKKKEDTVGVGGNGSYAWGDKWWEKAFDSAVATVDEDSSDSSDSDSDDEHMAGIAVAVNRDGTRTSASADELKLLASLSKGGRLAAGRFGGRDAKMARIREQEAKLAAEYAAKLGVPSVATAGTAGTAGTTGRGSDMSDTTSEVQLSGGGGKKRRKGGEGGGAAAAGTGPGQQPGQQPGEGQQPAKKQRIVIEPKIAQVAPVHEFKPTPATGWWGEKRFCSAGCLEGLDQAAAEAARRRMTFDEDDQARIYTAAQAKKAQGKVGLGQGTGTVKVGGVKWEGKKVSFEDAEEGGGEAADEAGGEGAPRGRLAAIGSSTHLATLAGGGEADALDAAAAAEAAAAGKGGKKKKGKGKGKDKAAPAAAEDTAPPAPAAGAADAAAPSWEASVKWKKIISQQLAAAEQQQLKLKELQRLVVAAVLDKHGGGLASKAAVKAAFASRLEGSSRFVVQGKLVKLRS
ncbi:hypothetical protein ABPG75_011228 [Micractinium tetrahymenae]